MSSPFTRALGTRALGTSALLALAVPVAAQDLVVPSGSTLVYDTSDGPIRADNVIVESGAALRALGPEALRVYARHSIVVDGLVDLSGLDSPGVLTLNTTHVPEPGAAGGPAGGRGGTASRMTIQSTPDGLPGLGTGPQTRGGQGGESGFAFIQGLVSERRGAGGGGGALAPDQPLSNDPGAPENLGLIAFPGQAGSSQALGAVSMSSPPVGGLAGRTPFRDGNAANDFFGRQRGAGGAIVVGELAAPIAGRGGGAGGDSVASATFPGVPFSPNGDEKGSGGGGGGGLGILVAPSITVGSGGAIRADGGDGGGGENTLFLNRVGGGSGGGSGGFVLLQARIVDLSAASADALSALGGRGGPGAGNVFGATGAGGNGGPGLIQIHVPRGAADIRLPSGVSLAELSSPDAQVLLPEPGL